MWVCMYVSEEGGGGGGGGGGSLPWGCAWACYSNIPALSCS